MPAAGMSNAVLASASGMSAGLPPSANMFDEANYLHGKPGEPERKKKKKLKTQQPAGAAPYMSAAL